MDSLPTQARVVIVGGGIVGCSVAYHLTELGWRDVVVIEQGRLSGGTTWHAAGLVGQLRSHANMTRLIRTSTDTGRVVILDSRLLNRRYGKRILDALPPFKRVIG